jgi:hypothetical protein
MGKCSNVFFSETAKMIKAKLNMNIHWMVLYKLEAFCSDMKFKMVATAGLSLTLNSLTSLYRSPGYKKNQLVLCKNYVLQW